MATLHTSLFVGQSNAVGAVDDISGTQANPNNIQRFTSAGALTALQAPDTNSESSGAQRPARSFGDAAWAGGSHRLVVNTHAQGGLTYTQLKKGTARYQDAITAITNGVAQNPSHTVVVESIHCVHGESETGVTGRNAYAGELNKWRSDFTADLKAATGQTTDPHFFVDQLGYYSYDDVALGQLEAARRNPLTWMVGPKYHLPGTSPHYTPAGHHYLGEYHAKAYRKVVLDGLPWRPVMPSKITQTGARTIVIDFHVPTPPLVFDTTLVASQTNRGLSVTANGSVQNLSSVTLTGDAQVTITSAFDLTGTLRVRCATSNIRDSDPELSRYDGSHLYNWCVMFSDPVGYDDTLPVTNSLVILGGGLKKLA